MIKAAVSCAPKSANRGFRNAKTAVDKKLPPFTTAFVCVRVYKVLQSLYIYNILILCLYRQQGRKMKKHIIFFIIAATVSFFAGCVFGYIQTNRQYDRVSVALHKERLRIYNQIKENYGVYEKDCKDVKKIAVIDFFKSMALYVVEENGVKTIRVSE